MYTAYMDQRGHPCSSHAWHESNHLKYQVIPSYHLCSLCPQVKSIRCGFLYFA
jgi:hypothetical protein